MSDIIDDDSSGIDSRQLDSQGEAVAPLVAPLDAPLDAPLGSSVVASSDDGKIVSARGTKDGLVLRIDGRAEWAEILGEIEAFLGSRKRFFEGGELSVEWLESLPTKEQSKELEQTLKSHYGMTIITRRKKPTPNNLRYQEPTVASGDDHSTLDTSEISQESISAKQKELKTKRKDAVAIPLFDDSLTSRSLSAQIDIEASSAESDDRSVAQKYVHRVARLLGEEIYYDDDANARGSLRHFTFWTEDRNSF